MKVRELKELLSDVDDDAEVILSSDSEGNYHSPLASVWSGNYRATTKWYGEVGFRELTDEDRAGGYTDEDVIDGVPALILGPVS